MKKFGKKLTVAASAGVVALSITPAWAALDVTVTDAISAAKADASAAGILILGVVATLAGIRWVKRAMMN
ncbi:MAG: hypothetical protein HQL50_09155 [Magnetococcales bacterium]|nr:hypothetical protein [Magnetococcales bacterium]